MIGENVDARFAFCPGWNLELLKEATNGSFDKPERICYITTDTVRMYITLLNGSLCLQAFLKSENQWVQDLLSKRIKEKPSESWFKSEQTLVDKMKMLLFMQNPKVDESYYDSLPSAKEVLENLELNPHVFRMTLKHYMYVLDGNVKVDDADGLVTIWVAEGHINLPYSIKWVDGKPAPKADWFLQVDRALVHNDSMLEKVSGWFDKIADAFNARSSNSLWSKWCKIADKIFT